jgi:hypothetical protein
MQKQQQKQEQRKSGTTAEAPDAGVLHPHLSAMKPRGDGTPFYLWLEKSGGREADFSTAMLTVRL